MSNPYGRVRKYNLNENYFSNINHRSAYIAGFIMADGCMIKRKRGRNPTRLTIGLNPKDISLLEYIKNELEYTGPLFNIKQYDDRTQKYYYRTALCINSRIMCLDLINYWLITPNKTGRENLPDLEQDLFYSFICGLFDGDGHIRLINNGIRATLFSASQQFLISIRDRFNFGNVSDKASNGCFSYSIYGVETFMFRDLIYKNITISLERKKNVFFTFQSPNLDLPRRKFTALDDQIILQYFIDHSKPNFNELAELVNRQNTSSLVNRAVKLGVYIKKSTKKRVL